MSSITINRPNITLLRLVVNAQPGWFYPQDWYYDEEFANTPIVEGTYKLSSALSAASIVYEYLLGRHVIINGRGWLSHKYVWTSDTDANGNKVYVGGWALGRSMGLQIHRHLANPDVHLLEDLL